MIEERAADGTRVYLAMVQWQHRRGGDSHCLARMVLPPAGPPAVVVSEVRSNTYLRGIMSDFPAVAEALLAATRPAVELPPAEVVWIAHHGPFSSYEDVGPETYFLIPLSWDGEHYHPDGPDRLLDPAELAQALGGAVLEPVPAAVARLGHRF
jgi:hypothetical protein